MFQCPFLKLHLEKVLNLPPSVGSPIIVGVRPLFAPATGLPGSSPLHMTCKVDKSGVASFEGDAILSCPYVPDIVEFLKIEIVFGPEGKRGIAATSLLDTKPLFVTKQDSYRISMPFSPTFPHKRTDPHIEIQLRIENTGGGSFIPVNTTKAVAELKARISNNRVPVKALQAVFSEPKDGGMEDARDKICPLNVENIEWVKFPLIVAPHDNFTFGMTGRQLIIDKEYEQVMHVQNRTSSVVFFQIGQKRPDPETYECKTVPTKGILKPGEKIDIVVKMTLKCTTSVSLRVPIRVWGSKWNRAFQAPIYVDAQGTVSVKLDPSDIIKSEETLLGEGTFGSVYLAKYRGLPVAAKFLKAEAERSSASVRKEFENEVQMLQDLRHPCIVQFIGASHFDGKLAICTEYCALGSLGTLLDKKKGLWERYKDDLTMAFRIHAMLDLARALDYLHESNIIHRDVKPDNVLVCRLSLKDRNDVFYPVAKLTDFGTTRTVLVEKGHMNMMDFTWTLKVGSEPYMSKEISTEDQKYDVSTDTFSFAMTAYEVLTDCDCRKAFEDAWNKMGEEEAKKFKDSCDVHAYLLEKGIRPSFSEGLTVDPSLIEIVQKCWETEPCRRPPMGMVAEVFETGFCDEIDKSTAGPNPMDEYGGFETEEYYGDPAPPVVDSGATDSSEWD